MKEITMREAIREGLREEMARDDKVFIMGEGVFSNRGTFGVVGDLSQQFGPNRLIDTPLSEAAIAGAAVGAALGGYRPIPEIMFADFLFICMDEVAQKMAKWRYGHGAQGGMKLPIVLRTSIGGGFGLGIEHSATPLAYFMHTPGLKLVVPSTPYDAKGLIKTAIRDDNPVIYFEHKAALRLSGPVSEEEYTVPFGVADVKREGKDITVVALAMMVHHALRVADELATEGIDLEVIDPRTLEPLDIDTIVASAKKTGRVVLVDEDTERCGSMAEIATQIMERAFGDLKGPIKRVCAANVPIPVSPPLEKAVLPQPEWIVKAARDVMAY
jgi:pyruvate/2-oxoglutarate/acetoin dehydrogenase E1 component